ncbi:TetR/AcrR family transcriptional regulator [Pseudosporangium ferrugineum]|uniref:TetR family transcriptional regulator n=1 Tax=Pseudosporangium ferrugineum TaxID=439699 RepID=A0A2T0S3H8_9ACTN|nr:TetR/AcrR family transcriptional regulator [Pseudosporangium ferrugineum]PRY27873.1 TetR family transcriptional regulator [Pseudosporangium ferrugineum]
MVTFQRARSDEQRGQRRRVILDTAAAMLAEMPVVELSLNELSRRVGLAKSNVLRYFESREAVLLELMEEQTRAWVTGLEQSLAVDAAADPYRRAHRIATQLAASLEAYPVLCDLAGTQAAVLERNVSPAMIVRSKRATARDAARLARLVRRHLPELGEDDALRFTATAAMVAGPVWNHTHPSPAVMAALDAEPSLAGLRADFTTRFGELLELLLRGLLATASR